MAAGIVGGPVRAKPDPRECRHEVLAYLGEGGTTSYYRCRICGAGVIEQHGRRWVLRR